ncbi:MAG: SMP-30/gluconolactonase/LRE family protein [Planctomycetes bacterium]|nr:SMP-30/gluconolactonase/LRE family protein [Planctomycetota bacterium]
MSTATFLAAAVATAFLLHPALAAEPPATAPSLVEVAKSQDYQWTGVAVSSTGRIFVSYPRWAGPYRWAVAEIQPDGSAAPFPDAKFQEWDAAKPAPSTTSFICVQSVYVDDKDRLWILDPASPQLSGVVPGAAKAVCIKLGAKDQVESVINFPESVAPADSYLDDIRVDTARNIAYITDSGRGGIIVCDLARGTSRRVLDAHPSVMAEKILPTVQGTPLRFAGGPHKGEPAAIQSDGIALSRDGERLYWQALTARTLYAIPTAALRDESLSAEQLAAKVESLGETVVTDGMEIGPDNAVYFTAIEKDAIISRSPRGEFNQIAHDSRLAWPDSLAWGRDGSLYITTSQIHLTPWFSGKDEMPRTPYLLLKLNPRAKP